MADLNEAEIRQITSSYQKVEQAYQSLRARFSKKNDWGSFQSDLGEAQSALRTYTTAENQALKNADKIFEDAMSGKGGFFQNDGFLTSTNQIGEKAAKEIKGIINDYYSAANDIIKSIPSIGDFNSHYKLYTPSEYSGDKDYSSMKESDSSNNSNDSGVVVAAVAPSISNHSDYPDNDDVREMESPTPENFDVEVNADKSANTKVSGIFETDRQAAVLGIGAISKLNARKILCTNVTEIQANAFKNLDKTEVIVLSDKIRQINVNAFRCVANSCIIAFINDRSTVESTLPSLECINNRKVIFGYQANDEYNPEKVVTFSSSKQETESKPKRVIIKANLCFGK